jgi:hypothetical protein
VAVRDERKLNNEQRNRPGHTIARTVKGHPRRAARRDRAEARAKAHVCVPSCRRFRLGKEDWPDA